MNDEELRALLRDAHRDDAPPPLSAVLGRARRRRRPPLALALPLVAAIALVVLWVRRPHAPAPAPSLTIAFNDPLGFLLEPPTGGDVLHSVPQFDTGGELQ